MRTRMEAVLAEAGGGSAQSSAEYNTIAYQYNLPHHWYNFPLTTSPTQL